MSEFDGGMELELEDNSVENSNQEQSDCDTLSASATATKVFSEEDKLLCKVCGEKKWPECFWDTYTKCVPCEYLRTGKLDKIPAALRQEALINEARARGEILRRRPGSAPSYGGASSRRPATIKNYSDLRQCIKVAKEDGLRAATLGDYMPCITPDEVIAAAYTGRCFVSGAIYDPYDPNSVKLVMDHDHETGEFRGWIQRKYNSMLGHAGDSIENLLLGVEYLQQSKEARKMSNDYEAQSLVQFGSKGGKPRDGWDPFAPKIQR